MMIRVALIAVLMASPAMTAESVTPIRVIRANDVIGPTDVTRMDFDIPGAVTAGSEIIGMEARVTLYPGRPIMLEHVGPAAVVTRNQNVTLVYRDGALSIAADARALSRGGVGDFVRVMNLSSRATVVGRVRADGAIEVTSKGSTH